MCLNTFFLCIQLFGVIYFFFLETKRAIITQRIIGIAVRRPPPIVKYLFDNLTILHFKMQRCFISKAGFFDISFCKSKILKGVVLYILVKEVLADKDCPADGISIVRSLVIIANNYFGLIGITP